MASAMNVQQAKSLVLTLYYAATGKHDLDSQQLLVVLNTINQKYYRDAVRGIGSLLVKDSADITTAADGSIDFSGTTVDSNGVYQVMAVEVKYLGRYLKLEYEIPQDRYIYNIAFGQVQALIPSAYTLMGEKAILLPRAATQLPVRLTYVPGLPNLSSDSDTLLNGKLPSFHDSIAYEAALLLVPRDADRLLAPIVQELKSQWNEYLQSRQRQDGRHIRYVPWE
jgi:hypothetical protein